MPRPPILPTIDWKALFETGKTYTDWLAIGENPEGQSRMQASLSELSLDPEIQNFVNDLPKTVHVIAIAEDWCGDVVRHVPVLIKLEQSSPKLHVRFIARADSPDTFARFLTNGGEAIPKFVFLSDQFVECGNWGPMPHDCRELISRGKACGDVKAAREIVSERYKADSEKRVVARELAHLIDIASSVSPRHSQSLASIN